jgi:hypothetical protein
MGWSPLRRHKEIPRKNSTTIKLSVVPHVRRPLDICVVWLLSELVDISSACWDRSKWHLETFSGSKTQEDDESVTTWNFAWTPEQQARLGLTIYISKLGGFCSSICVLAVPSSRHVIAVYKVSEIFKGVAALNTVYKTLRCLLTFMSFNPPWLDLCRCNYSLKSFHPQERTGKIFSRRRSALLSIWSHDLLPWEGGGGHEDVAIADLWCSSSCGAAAVRLCPLLDSTGQPGAS